eukprot:490556-Rhodomonas_salina.1
MAVGACSTALILGAYYYTWYGVGEQWQVFPRTFEPTMGEYHSASDDVMRIHHSQGQEACLDFFAVSWGGDGTRSHGKHRIDSAPEPVVGTVPLPAIHDCFPCEVLLRRPLNSRALSFAGRCVVHDSDGVHMSPFCTDNEGNEVEPARGHLYKVQGWKEAMRWWTPSADVDTLIQRSLSPPMRALFVREQGMKRKRLKISILKLGVFLLKLTVRQTEQAFRGPGRHPYGAHVRAAGRAGRRGEP